MVVYRGVSPGLPLVGSYKLTDVMTGESSGGWISQSLHPCRRHRASARRRRHRRRSRRRRRRRRRSTTSGSVPGLRNCTVVDPRGQVRRECGDWFRVQGFARAAPYGRGHSLQVAVRVQRAGIIRRSIRRFHRSKSHIFLCAAGVSVVVPLTIDHVLQFLYEIHKLKQYIDSNQGRRLSAQTTEFVGLYLEIGWAVGGALFKNANNHIHLISGVCGRAGYGLRALFRVSHTRLHDLVRPLITKGGFFLLARVTAIGARGRQRDQRGD